MSDLDMSGEYIEGEDDSLGEFAAEILGEYPAEILGAEADESGEYPAEILGDDDLMGDDDSGAWLHMLNPSYWFKSSREKKLISIDRQKGKENVALQKRLAEQKKEMEQAEKTAATAAAVRTARDESQAMEARLQQITEEASSAGIGADSPAVEAAEKGVIVANRNKRRANALMAKLEANEKLSPDELSKLRMCLKTCSMLRRLHRQLHKMDDVKMMRANAPGVLPPPAPPSVSTAAVTSSGYRGPDYIEPTAPSETFIRGFETTEILGTDDLIGITDKQWIAMSALSATEPAKLGPYMQKNSITLTPQQQVHLKNLRALTVKGLKRKVEAAGVDTSGMSGEEIGSLWSGLKKVGKGALKVAAVAALPVAALAYGTYKGAKFVGKKTVGLFKKKAATPAQIQAQKVRAARARKLAALKRAQAAREKNAVLRKKMLEEADAAAETAQAEAEAARAEEEAQAAEGEAEGTAEAAEEAPYMDENNPETTAGDDDLMGYGVSLIGTDYFEGEWVGAVKHPKAKKIVKTAASNTPAGKKIRAGATVIRAAKAGNPKARAAVKKVVVKAKKGDPQAKRDVNALRAGNIALKAKKQATRKVAIKKKIVAMKNRVVASKRAADTKGIATRRKLEVASAERLARFSRKRQLVKVAKVERAAARGNKKAKAAVANVVAKAKGGDKKAKTTAAALLLARRTRLSATTPRERKNLVAAGKVVRKAQAGNKKAVKQLLIVNAAAKKGQPNAKRAMARVRTAAAVESAIRTGVIKPPALTTKTSADGIFGAQTLAAVVKFQSSAGLKPDGIVGAGTWKALGVSGQPTLRRGSRGPAVKLLQQKLFSMGAVTAAPTLITKYEQQKKRATSPVASREEVLATAKTAQQLGKTQEAGKLVMLANTKPSATQTLKETAAVAAAAQNKDPVAQQMVKETLAKAGEGDPESISKAGQLAAVQTIEGAKQGKPMAPQVAEAVHIVQRAQANDPEALRTVERAGNAAQSGDPKGVEAAIALTAASALLAATAAKPTAQAQLVDQANEARGLKLQPAEVQKTQAEFAGLHAKVLRGEASPQEAERARNLAMALKKPALAAEISVLMPPRDQGYDPRTSLPDAPLPPIRNFSELLRESVKALTLATPDPLANYREGVQSRGASTMVAVPPGPAGDDEAGSWWNPFSKAAVPADRYMELVGKYRSNREAMTNEEMWELFKLARQRGKRRGAAAVKMELMRRRRAGRMSGNINQFPLKDWSPNFSRGRRF
jgi:peptidoglycan hydrolase-like protein with peptidoglycan-binding domain